MTQPEGRVITTQGTASNDGTPIWNEMVSVTSSDVHLQIVRLELVSVDGDNTEVVGSSELPLTALRKAVRAQSKGKSSKSAAAAVAAKTDGSPSHVSPLLIVWQPLFVRETTGALLWKKHSTRQCGEVQAEVQLLPDARPDEKAATVCGWPPRPVLLMSVYA